MKNKLKIAMMNSDTTMRELAKKTGVDLCKISKFRVEEDKPTHEELKLINECLGSSLAIDDFKIDEERKKNSEATMKALNMAYEKAKITPKGFLECPLCGKKLFYNKSSYNGHVWGKCETKDCIAWMM